MGEIKACAAHSGNPSRDLELVLIGEGLSVLEVPRAGDATFHEIAEGEVVHREDLPSGVL